MPIDLWIAFALTSMAVLAIPGPTVLLVVSYAMGKGRGSGLYTVPGVALGDLTAMTVSLAGAGAVLAASADLFTLLKLVGAAYLVYLGIKLWRSDPTAMTAKAEDLPPADKRAAGGRMFWNAYVVTALNPKSIVFFVAFVPQFMDPGYPWLPQAAILEVTFVLFAAINVGLWAWAAGAMRDRFSRPESLKRVNRIGGLFLIGAGVLTAIARR
ncbi:MAG: LysE family translocator [Magnetovibrionaceae bacterium]